MITPNDKLSVFRKIIENDILIKSQREHESIEQDVRERLGDIEQTLLKELSKRMDYQEVLLDTESREQIGQQEAAQKMHLLKQKQAYLDELMHELESEIGTYLQSDAFLTKLVDQKLPFDRVQGPAAGRALFARYFPDVTYEEHAHPGYMLYDDTQNLRYDFTLRRILERSEKNVDRLFQQKVGD